MDRTRTNGTIKRIALAALTLALTAALAMPAAAQVALPQQVINDDATAVIWMDMQLLTPEQIGASAKSVVGVLPAGLTGMMEDPDAQVDSSMAYFQAYREAFLGAGGQGLVMVLLTQNDETGVAESTVPVTLMRVAPGTDPEAFRNALNAVEEVAAPEFAVVTDGWLVQADEAAMVPTDGTEELAAQFSQLLEQVGEVPVRVVFHANEAVQKRIQALAANPADAGFAASLVGPMQSLRSGSAALTFGEEPKLRQSLTFTNAEAAQQFNTAWDSLLMMAQAMAQAQAGPEAPDPQLIQNLLNSLKMQQDGANLNNELDKAFVGTVGQIAEPYSEMIMFLIAMQLMGEEESLDDDGMGEW